ncbi:MAG: efflux RND transporter permease subunit, partial [Ignavibacteria bacterium]|nr:efflux RND transporter permease subunit [Ignavibacteria bacterium]
MTITELAIKRPTLVVVVFSVLGILGIYGFAQLNYELMPKLTAPVITIQTIYPGASPFEVQNNVTKLIEDAITGMELISNIRSSSREGVSFIFVELEMSADVDKSIQDALRRINQVQDLLPKDARKPVVSKIAFDEVPVIRANIQSKLDSKELTQFVKDNILPLISKLKGVGLIQILGANEREISVSIDMQKLKAYGLSLNTITQSIISSNIDFPTGSVKEIDNQYVVRVAGKFNSIEELENHIIGRTKSGGEIRLKDIANVQDGIKEITNINRLNFNPSIGILIQKQTDANTVEVSKLVRKEFSRLEKEYSDIGLKFEIAQDNSTFIMEAANAVKKDLALAVLIVAFVMFVFLHSIRNSLIVLVSIPTSLITTFFLMYIFNFTLNTITLLAMSLVIGILVDDSIVVIENITRHLEKGEDKITAAIRGRNEIGFAALSITLVDVVVFFPLSLITGMIGTFLRQYALVVVFSTLMSLFVSFTVTPWLASRISKVEAKESKGFLKSFSKFIDKVYQKLEQYYVEVLGWALNNGGKVFIVATIIFISSLMLPGLGFIGTEFIPNVDRGEIIFTIETEPGSTIEKTNQLSIQVENLLRQQPEVVKIVSNVGFTSEGILGQFQPNTSQILVQLVDKNQRNISTDEFAQLMKEKINTIPGIKIKAQPITLLGTTGRTPIQIRVSGPDYQSVFKGAEIVDSVVRTVRGATDVSLSSEQGNPELRVEIDRNRLAQFGLSIFDVSSALRIALTGNDDSKFTEEKNDIPIRIQLEKFDRYNVEDVQNIPFTNREGKTILLKQFANVYQSIGPTKLERENRAPCVYVNSMIFGRASGDVSNDIAKKLKEVKLPPGVDYAFVGEQKSMRDSFQSLLTAIIIGTIFVYLILVALYNSYLYPFVIMFSIPLAAIGAFYGLAFTMKTISLYSILGMITIIGLVAKNGILLVDRTNYMKFEMGYPTRQALLDAAKVRLRPILMTTFAMVFGMMPIALASSAGSEAKSGLAVVIIGGLLSSLFLTLIVVPVVYQKFDKWREAFHRIL